MSYSITNNRFIKRTTKEIERRAKERLARKNNRGNWEFSFLQKYYDPNNEATIKVSMNPNTGFDPKLVDQYINPMISKEETIVNMVNDGVKLNTSQKIIYNNYITKKTEEIKNDIKMIKTIGVAAEPKTKEGKTRLILEVLKSQLKESNHISVANIYLRLLEDTFFLTESIKNDYKTELAKMNSIVSQLNMIELQFTKFHSQMPPLNNKGFKKFDDWQIKVIDNINKNISTIVNAPTSAGKSVLSGYVTTKGKSLFVMPTDALAWQMSAYIGHIIGMNVPILTQTYQTNPNRDEMIGLLKDAMAVVGTAESIIDFLPFMEKNFKWVIFDEIHMIGKKEGSGMEHIAKVLNNIPILALSATIGNTDELVDWFKKISPDQIIEKVICNKRFFNLQRYFYDLINNSLVSLHPLSLVDIKSFDDGSILSKSLQPTPKDTWDLTMKLKSKFDLGDINPDIYFNKFTDTRIELDDAMKYFNVLIEFMINKCKDEQSRIFIKDIIDSYVPNTLESSTVNLVNLTFKLKSEEKLPCIIFQKNTIACLRLARNYAKELDCMETLKYPHLVKDRSKLEKKAKQLEKKIKSKEDMNSVKDENLPSKYATTKDKVSKKEMKETFGKKAVVKETIDVVSIQEPHDDFNLNNNQYFSETTVEEWNDDLQKYFPKTGDYYHFMIKLLWRGIGVYAKGLPDPYLRLVQSLACQKKLAVVFSDESLVFGVSMPFRTVIIIRDDKTEDDLDAMLYHQMSGRAGRRGLDKEGNIIFAGYSWDRIKELSVSTVPIVKGNANIMYSTMQADELSNIYKTNMDWSKVNKDYLDTNVTNDEGIEFYDGIKSNYMGGWHFALNNHKDVNHLHMNWKFRYNEEGIIASYLIPFLRKAFEMKDHTLDINQLELGHFLCRFISTQETSNMNNVLEEPVLLSQSPYNLIVDHINDLQLEIPKNIDNRLYRSLQLNALVKDVSEDVTDKLRNRLMEFGEKIKTIQHFCFHSKIIGLTRILGKLLTRIWWIYHTSSPIMKPYNSFETEDFVNIDNSENESSNDNTIIYESESDSDSETDSDNEVSSAIINEL